MSNKNRTYKILIIGFGSVGKKHANILKKYKKVQIKILSKQKNLPFKNLKSLRNVANYNPNYIIIAAKTSEHHRYIEFIENNFNKKLVLVEKPLFEKYKKVSFKNNYYYIGYNLRFHPILKFLKKKKLKPFYVKVNCSSFLPDWRKNIHYSKSNSALKKNGGGVALELSHELDYITWLYGEMKIINFLNKKISNLKINTDDLLVLNSKIKNKNIYLNINLNFFSKIEKREIYIYTKNKNFYADLINNKLHVYSDSKKTLSWKKFTINQTYKEEHNLMMLKKFKNLCSLQEGNKVLKIISKINRLQ